MDGGAGGQTDAPVRSWITSNEKTKVGGKEEEEKGNLSKFILQPVRLCQRPRHQASQASKRMEKRREKEEQGCREKKS